MKGARSHSHCRLYFGLTWGVQAEKRTIFLLMRDDRVVRNKICRSENQILYLLTVLENRLLLGLDNALVTRKLVSISTHPSPSPQDPKWRGVGGGGVHRLVKLPLSIPVSFKLESS